MMSMASITHHQYCLSHSDSACVCTTHAHASTRAPHGILRTRFVVRARASYLGHRADVSESALILCYVI